MIDVFYSGNDLMFDGIFLSTISIVRKTKENIFFHILTMDFTSIDAKYRSFTNKQAKKLENILKIYNANTRVDVIDVKNHFEKFLSHSKNEKPHYSPYTTLRLLIDEIDVKGKVIYLDCDTMAVGDIKTMYDIDMENIEIRACHDYMGRFWINKNYFNAGTLLINVDEIRKTNLFKKCCDLIRKKRMYFTDQTALFKCVTKFEFYPNEYRFNEQRKIKSDTIIKHFCKGIQYFPYFYVYNIKQWNIRKVHSFLKIHDFDEEYKIFERFKENNFEILSN